METRHAEFLLVEDNPADVRLTKEALKEGMLKPHLSVTSNGVEALAFLRREGSFADAPRPDLILLDLNLPKKDGREVLAEVKNDPDLRRIPIVVLTTSQADEDIQRSYDLHANCFVTKALDLEHFVDTVRSIESFWLSTVRLPSDRQPLAQRAPSGTTPDQIAAPGQPADSVADAVAAAQAPHLGDSSVASRLGADHALADAAPFQLAQPAEKVREEPASLASPASWRGPFLGPILSADGDEHAVGPLSAEAAADQTRAVMRILLVEDNRADARLVREMLVDTAVPFELTHVTRLAEAIERVTAGDIDVILLDLSLPDGEGLKMVSALRDTARAPIVVMSGHNDESLAVKGVREGAQDYLVKGQVDGDDLVRALRYAIERQRTEDHLRYVAHHDPLTGLPNRALLHDRLRQQLAQARRHDHPLAVLFLDLDRFKWVNDTLGHDMGDRLLQEVADRLACCTRGGDTVARLGGDEFVLLLPDLTQPRDAATVAEKIISVLADPFLLGAKQVAIGASIGISLYPGDGVEPDTLLKAADAALYDVKERGRNGYAFFEDIDMESSATREDVGAAGSSAEKAYEQHAEAHPSSRDGDAERGVGPTGRGTILVIDDDPFIVDLLEALLEEKGYRVLAALGEEALHLARETQPDVILTDLMMPTVDGVQMSRLLRADPATTAIPIVAMSAQMNLRATSELIPVDGRLAKPFDLDLLYRTIAQWATPR